MSRRLSQEDGPPLLRGWVAMLSHPHGAIANIQMGASASWVEIVLSRKTAGCAFADVPQFSRCKSASLFLGSSGELNWWM